LFNGCNRPIPQSKNHLLYFTPYSVLSQYKKGFVADDGEKWIRTLTSSESTFFCPTKDAIVNRSSRRVGRAIIIIISIIAMLYVPSARGKEFSLARPKPWTNLDPKTGIETAPVWPASGG
jgi:hypothetical protein